MHFISENMIAVCCNFEKKTYNETDEVQQTVLHQESMRLKGRNRRNLSFGL